MIKHLLYIAVFLVGFYSCSSESANEEKHVAINQLQFDNSLTDEVKSVIDNIQNDSLLSNYKSFINAVYSKNNFAPFWLTEDLTLNEDGKRFSELLYHSVYFGLDSGRYVTKRVRKSISEINKDKPESLAGMDVLLTGLYSKFGKDVNAGIIDTAEFHPVYGHKAFKVNLSEYFIDNFSKENLVKGLLALQPQIGEYRELQLGLENFLKEHELKDSSIAIEKYSSKQTLEDSIRIYNKARKALVLHDYIENEDVSDSIFIEALKAFQLNHGLNTDARIGKNTAEALSGNPYEFYKRAVVSLEKWRWVEPDSLESEYILANIATYKLRIYKNEKLVEEHKVVVGAYPTQTPELNSKIDYMIAYPFWTVPYSIKTKE